MHYLDAAATAPLRSAARNAMLKVLEGAPANASSVHTPGQLAKDVLRQARQQVATGLGARDAEVVFTSGGTEANNLLLKGVALAAPRGKHIVTSVVEHSSVRQTCAFLSKFAGVKTYCDAWSRVSLTAPWFCSKSAFTFSKRFLSVLT